jgi:hypothetical protein
MSSSIPTSSAAGHAGGAGWHGRKHAFGDLAKALSSGDLDAAKKAYAEIQSEAPKRIANDPDGPLAKIGKALDAGELAGAQQAFAAIRQGRQRPEEGTAPEPSAGASDGTTIDVTV